MRVVTFFVMMSLCLKAFASDKLPFKESVKESSKAGASAASGSETDQAELSNRLKQGNKRFVEGKMSNPNQTPQFRESLASGQKPFAIIVSCSDSRVPPELVFDTGLGDLFVVRTAGHVLDSAAIASIEYAVEHLHSGLIVILGHESCGAVNATLSAKDGVTSGSFHIDKLISKIRPNVKNFRGSQIDKSDKTLRGPVKANANGAARELVRTSELVRTAIKSRHVVLITGIYQLSSGKVEFNEWDTDLYGHEFFDKKSDSDAEPVVITH